MAGTKDDLTGTAAPPKQDALSLFSLQGRTIVVTGVAGGLGSAIARACLEAGANVAGLDIVERPAEDVLPQGGDGPRVAYYRADVADEKAVEEAVQAAVAELGPIHGCVACAGIEGHARFHECPAAELRKIIDVNLLGSYFTGQSVVRQLLKQGTPGSIIFIASGASHVASELIPLSAYGVTKYAVRGLAQQVAIEYASNGIRANSVSPGPMLTELSRQVGAQNAGIFEALQNNTMLKRFGRPDELNGAIIFLLSDASSYVTAEDILVDGGLTHF